MALHVQRTDDDFRIPSAGLQIIRQNVAHLTRPTETRAAILESSGEPGHRVLTPHKIYVADLDDCEDHLLEKARRIGWRYLLFEGTGGGGAEVTKPIAAVELESKPGSDETRFLCLVQNPAAQATFDILNEVADRVKDSDFELRFLQILDLNFAGLWFHCYADRDNDFIMPLPPAPDILKEKQSYRRAEFLPRIKELANRMEASFLEM